VTLIEKSFSGTLMVSFSEVYGKDGYFEVLKKMRQRWWWFCDIMGGCLKWGCVVAQDI